MVGPTIAQRRMYENPQKIGQWNACSRPLLICFVVIALLGLTWYWFRPEEAVVPRKSRSGAEFGDIWDARMGATEDEGGGEGGNSATSSNIEGGSLSSDPRKLLQGRRTLTKIDEWDYGDLPEKDMKPLDLRKGISSSFPFIVAQYRDREAISNPAIATSARSQYFKPIRFVLPFWHPDAAQSINTGAPLEPTPELRFHHQNLLEMLNLYTQQLGITSDSKNNIMKQFPIVVDVGSCLGELPLVAASLGLRSIVYEPVFVNAEKIRLSLAFNGFEELVTVIEAAASDEIGEMEIAVPSDPKLLCSSSTSLENIPGAVTYSTTPSSPLFSPSSPLDPNSPASLDTPTSTSSSSSTSSPSPSLPTINQETHSWLGVQMLRLDYSVEWLNLIDDILVLHISTQGFEKQVLKGASNLFKMNRIHNVIHEFWPEGIEHSGGEPLGVLLNMEDLGFQLKTMKEATAFEVEREFKRLVQLGNERVTLHWVRKQK